jgi:hypothetical protein
MRKTIIVFILLLSTITSQAATLTVCASGCNHTTIQAAINAASASDIIQINDATHTELSITVNKSDLTIKGSGQTATILQAHASQGSASDRIFLINNGITVTFEDMTMRHGNTTGRGGCMLLNTNAVVTLNQVTITNNDSDEDGGGIATASSTSGIDITMTNCIVENNNGGVSDIADGGGIYNSGGDLTMTNCSIVNNSCGDDGAGVYLVESGATHSFTNCTISGNVNGKYTGGGEDFDGGGILISTGTLNLVHCTVSNNTTGTFAGGISIFGGTVNMTNNIFADNIIAPSTSEDMRTNPSVIGTNNNNLVETCVGGDCPTFTSSSDPGLQSLNKCTNGRYVQAISGGSAAENAGSNLGLADICGGSRNNPPDLGSYEIGSALPVELIAFDGKSAENGILLTWQTATEINNAGFELERSTGDHWEFVAFIEGNGTTFETIEYQFLDENPLNEYGDNLYRLKQVDEDGTYEYSPMINVSFESGIGNYELNIFPNPIVGEQLNIQYNGANQAEISILNAMGQTVQSLVIQNNISIPMDELSTGIYFIEVRIGNDKRIEKIVVP